MSIFFLRFSGERGFLIILIIFNSSGSQSSVPLKLPPLTWVWQVSAGFSFPYSLDHQNPWEARLYKKVKFYGRRKHFVQWFCLLKCALLNVYQRFFYYVYVLWRVAGPGFYCSAGPRNHNRSYYGSWLGTSTCFQQKGFVYLPSKRKLFSGLL